jgi:hypothetical protein
MHACMHACNKHRNRWLTLISGLPQPPMALADEERPMRVFSGTRTVRTKGLSLIPVVANVSAIRLRYQSQISNWKYPLVPGGLILDHISRPNRARFLFTTGLLPATIPRCSATCPGLGNRVRAGGCGSTNSQAGQDPHRNRV